MNNTESLKNLYQSKSIINFNQREQKQNSLTNQMKMEKETSTIKNLINEQTFELLEKTGLNWTVNKEPLFTEDGKDSKGFGLYRNDNQNHLAVVGSGYRIYQNHEMCEMMVNASEGIGMKTSRGGSLQGGRKVFLQIQLDSKKINTDTVKRYITCLNSHDGTTSIGFGSTNEVLVCSNQFHKMYRGSDTRIQHTTHSKTRVEKAMEDLRLTILDDNKLMRSFELMADAPISDTILKRVMDKAFGIDLDAKQSDYSSRKINQMKEVNDVIANELDSHGSSLWGLFNGVTYYTNHISKKDAGDEYLMTGSGYDKNLVTFREIMSWISEHTQEDTESFLIK